MVIVIIKVTQQIVESIPYQVKEKGVLEPRMGRSFSQHQLFGYQIGNIDSSE